MLAPRTLLRVTGISEGKGVFLCSGSEAAEFGARALQSLHLGSLFLAFTDSHLGSHGTGFRKAPGECHLIGSSPGMERTGRSFGFPHYDMAPDMVAWGKGLGNRYPVSALACTRKVAADLEKADFRYSQSHQNEVLGTSAVESFVHSLREDKFRESPEAQTDCHPSRIPTASLTAAPPGRFRTTRTRDSI